MLISLLVGVIAFVAGTLYGQRLEAKAIADVVRMDMDVKTAFEAIKSRVVKFL